MQWRTVVISSLLVLDVAACGDWGPSLAFHAKMRPQAAPYCTRFTIT